MKENEKLKEEVKVITTDLFQVLKKYRFLTEILTQNDCDEILDHWDNIILKVLLEREERIHRAIHNSIDLC
jgi:hypothetical protein